MMLTIAAVVIILNVLALMVGILLYIGVPHD